MTESLLLHRVGGGGRQREIRGVRGLKHKQVKNLHRIGRPEVEVQRALTGPRDGAVIELGVDGGGDGFPGNGQILAVRICRVWLADVLLARLLDRADVLDGGVGREAKAHWQRERHVSVQLTAIGDQHPRLVVLRHHGDSHAGKLGRTLRAGAPVPHPRHEHQRRRQGEKGQAAEPPPVKSAGAQTGSFHNFHPCEPRAFHFVHF